MLMFLRLTCCHYSKWAWVGCFQHLRLLCACSSSRNLVQSNAVFELVLKPDGSYTFTLLGPLDHAMNITLRPILAARVEDSAVSICSMAKKDKGNPMSFKGYLDSATQSQPICGSKMS